MPRSMKIILIVLVILVVIALVAASRAVDRSDPIVTDETIHSHLINEAGEVVATPPPAPIPTPNEDMYDSDIFWLARVMQVESGPSWSDEDCIKIGEVVLNRVASPAFPNTVKEVVLQDGQYEPFFDYEFWVPNPYYIWLAARLMHGETYLNDADVIWQALFPQGEEVVDVIYDNDLKDITYLCK